MAIGEAFRGHKEKLTDIDISREAYYLILNLDEKILDIVQGKRAVSPLSLPVKEREIKDSMLPLSLVLAANTDDMRCHIWRMNDTSVKNRDHSVVPLADCIIEAKLVMYDTTGHEDRTYILRSNFGRHITKADKYSIP